MKTMSNKIFNSENQLKPIPNLLGKLLKEIHREIALEAWICERLLCGGNGFVAKERENVKQETKNADVSA